MSYTETRLIGAIARRYHGDVIITYHATDPRRGGDDHAAYGAILRHRGGAELACAPCLPVSTPIEALVDLLLRLEMLGARFVDAAGNAVYVHGFVASPAMAITAGGLVPSETLRCPTAEDVLRWGSEEAERIEAARAEMASSDQ